MPEPKAPLEDYQPVKSGARGSHEGDSGPLGGTLPGWAPQIPLKYQLGLSGLILVLFLLGTGYARFAARLFIAGLLLAIVWRVILKARHREES